jgi:hypothetical protein
VKLLRLAELTLLELRPQFHSLTVSQGFFALRERRFSGFLRAPVVDGAYQSVLPMTMMRWGASFLCKRERRFHSWIGGSLRRPIEGQNCAQDELNAAHNSPSIGATLFAWLFFEEA